VSLLKAIFLGIIQGLTEFFPVSSSAHLKLIRYLFHIQTNDLFFDLICHGGTLLALIFFLRKEVFSSFLQKDKIKPIFFALIPLPIIYLLLHPIVYQMSNMRSVGMMMILSGSFLGLASFYERKIPSRKIKDMLCIGVMQGMALLPGLSRSGMTIAMGSVRGWPIKEAVLFSFLLAIPTVMGGIGLEAIKQKEVFSLPISHYIAGFISSFIVGILAIRVIFSLWKKKQVSDFAFYCSIIRKVGEFFFKG